MSAFFFDYCTYPDIIPHKRLYIHNPAICHSLCLSHEHSSYDVGLDNRIDNADDIDDQPNPNIYQYEKNGNLRRDNQEHIQLEWTMAGKVKKVINTLTTNTKAEFLYDAMGNRVRKTVYTSAGSVERNIFYTYAPDGKLLQMTEQSNEGLLMSMEYPLYGISRLGLYKVTNSLSRDDESANLYIFPRYFDRRMYELTDHLGNVRAVVGDRKLWNSSFAGEFRANVLSVSNYYPFGMAQTGRNWDSSNGNYRYGYNGKEEDNEIKTNSGDNGKSLDYGARWYDPRKARWDAVDPLANYYTSLSPYHYSGNNPILFVDSDGRHFGLIIDHRDGKKSIQIVTNIHTSSQQANDEARAAVALWSSKEFTIDGYKVTFNLNVMDPVVAPFEGAELTNFVTEAAMNARSDNPPSNAYFSTDHPESKRIDERSSRREDHYGGYAVNRYYIYMNKARIDGASLGSNEDLVAHEFGHLFGLDDQYQKGTNIINKYYPPGNSNSIKSIMRYKGFDLDDPSEADVKMILKYAKDYLSVPEYIRSPKMNTNVNIVEQQGSSNGNNPIGVSND